MKTNSRNYSVLRRSINISHCAVKIFQPSLDYVRGRSPDKFKISPRLLAYKRSLIAFFRFMEHCTSIALSLSPKQIFPMNTKCHSWHITLWNEGCEFPLQWFGMRPKWCEWERLTHPAGKWLLKLYFSIPSVPSATLWRDFEERDRKQDENCHYAEPCLLYRLSLASDMESV